jgi:serine/threonine protein kinase
MSQTWEQFWKPDEAVREVSGGQGTVTKVTSLASNSIGALKRIHTSHLGNSERRRRMAREVLALEKLHGEGVPQVLDHNMSEVENLAVPLYLVTRWIDGPSLQQIAGGKPCRVEEALKITRQLAVTLDSCHQYGVVHRDIKPDNIIIESESEAAVLVDFGLAWSHFDEGADPLTSMGQELGNRFFRLPDLSAGQEKRDPRTDVTFLVGILLFLLTGAAPRVLIDLTGRPPHEALSNRIPADVLSHPSWKLIRRIFRVGFQPSIDQRFQSVNDLLERLSEAMAQREVAQPPNYEQELEAIRSLLTSTSAEAMRQIEDSIYSVTSKLLERIRAISEGSELGVSTGDHRVLGEYAQCHFLLHVPGRGINSDGLFHRVKLEKPNRSFVSASYWLGQETGDNAVTYYRGPAADIERLEEEVLIHAEDMFQIVAKDLRARLEKGQFVAANHELPIF